MTAWVELPLIYSSNITEVCNQDPIDARSGGDVIGGLEVDGEAHVYTYTRAI